MFSSANTSAITSRHDPVAGVSCLARKNLCVLEEGGFLIMFDLQDLAVLDLLQITHDLIFSCEKIRGVAVSIAP